MSGTEYRIRAYDTNTTICNVALTVLAHKCVHVFTALVLILFNMDIRRQVFANETQSQRRR